MTSTPDDGRHCPQSDDHVEALLEQCLLRWEVDGVNALDELCREHPEHAAALRAGMALLRDSGIAPPTLPVAERLGDFRILSRLGGGGMGAVFVAEQLSLQRRVALKLIRPELLFFGSSRERFRREAEVVARLQHPAIVPVFAWGEENGLPYFAMELVAGCSLAGALAELVGRPSSQRTGADLAAAVATRAGAAVVAPWPLTGSWPRIAAAIALQVVAALQHAHERGVLHRDVKPSNILLGVDGRVRLLDFGLARAEGDLELTRSGTPLGSLPYMSPEQLGGRRDLDARTDVYSLGVTLHELIALERPFRGADAEALRAAILAGRRPPLPGPHDALLRDLETICGKATDLEVGRRYATVAALGEDLAAALDGRPIAAQRLGPLGRLRRSARRRPARAALALVLALGVPTTAVLGVLWWQNRAAGALGRSHAERVESGRQVALAFFCYRSGDHTEARRRFDAVLRADDHDELALIGRLLCGLSADDAGDLRDTLSRHPDAVVRHPMLGWFAAEAARLAGHGDEAAALLQRVPSSPPMHAIDWFAHAVTEAWLGKKGDETHFRTALQAIEQAILLDRSEVRSPIFHVYAAEMAVLCGDRDAAQRAARAIETMWPDSAIALGSAGRALMQADGPHSLELLTRARDLAPEQAMLHLYLAESLLFQERADEAAAAYEAALARAPRLGSAWGGLALLRLGQGRLDDALACSQHYVEVDAELGLAWKVRAQTLHLAQHWQEARGAYAEAVARMPVDAAAHRGYLATLRHLGDTAAATAEEQRFAGLR
ncbi:MAG: serine/threonine-protein kinase [Planctomycetota bacterium]